MIDRLLALAAIFGHLSLLAFGGFNSVLPEMQREVVEVHQWMSAREFAALYALAQASPGPNIMVTSLIGWQVAGLAGAVVSLAFTIGPPCLLTYYISRMWLRARHWRGRDLVRHGLVPLTAGLVLAGAMLLCATTSTTPATIAITAICTLIFVRTSINPLWLLAAAAGAGTIGLV
jgi:chromate transporter